MRFSNILIPSLVALTTASPNALVRREQQEVTDAIRFAIQADSCDLFKCAAVVASAACIGASIALGPAGIPSALGCTAGGASALCPCANCIDALGDFLKNNSVCPS